MLTAVLAIPLCKELPTLNARKTCALAIALIQIQRLPADVLSPAADRIAYALRRGIEGQLGKEGKKGSTSDGLKVASLTICSLYALTRLVGYPRPGALPARGLRACLRSGTRKCSQQPSCADTCHAWSGVSCPRWAGTCRGFSASERSAYTHVNDRGLTLYEVSRC